MVDAPLEELAVVRALARVPAEITEAFIAVTLMEMLADPSNEVAVPVAPPVMAIVLAVSNTVAFAAVPVRSAVIVFAEKFPLASRATMVDAPFEELAVVRALARVPAEITEAFMAVALMEMLAEPLNEVAVPVTPPVIAIVRAVSNTVAFAAVPVRSAVTVLAEKFPLPSRATMVDAPFESLAVVRAFAMVPLEIADALRFVMFAPENVAVLDPVPPDATGKGEASVNEDK
jgi:hypothetical protein